MAELIRECDIHGSTFDCVHACRWEGVTLFLCDRCSADIGAPLIRGVQPEEGDPYLFFDEIVPSPPPSTYYQFHDAAAAGNLVERRMEGPFFGTPDDLLLEIMGSSRHPFQEQAAIEFRRRHSIIARH